MIKAEPELSRPIDVSRIPPAGSAETVIAEPGECALIARRLGLPAIHRLRAELALTRWRGEGVKATGQFVALVEQICVVTLDPFEEEVSGKVERYFLPGSGKTDDEADIDFFADGTIDLGEPIIENLSLTLDPYPRKPGAEFHGVSDESPSTADETSSSPFAALAELKSRKR
jgi:uncharacterized metal-binding protein YceD (DUF177 family)